MPGYQMDNIEGFFAEEAAAQVEAAANVQPFQAALKPGDYIVRSQNGFIIYGEILDPTPALVEEEGLDPEALAEMRAEHDYEVQLRNQPHMAAYRFSKCFSQLCPQGELGDLHISTVTKVISKESFDEARNHGWPMDDGYVKRLT